MQQWLIWQTLPKYFIAIFFISHNSLLPLICNILLCWKSSLGYVTVSFSKYGKQITKILKFLIFLHIKGYGTNRINTLQISQLTLVPHPKPTRQDDRTWNVCALDHVVWKLLSNQRALTYLVKAYSIYTST